MTASPRPQDAQRDIENILSRHRGVYRHTAWALACLTGYPESLVRDELESLKAAGKVRQDGFTWSWVHVR
jgi:hypothetical protein